MDGNMENNQTVYNLTGKIAAIPVVDKTLTKSGYAADAKATGDAIAELKSRIDNIVNGLN